MNIVIFGHKRHGKDAACEYLKKRFLVNYTSSSWFACQKFLYNDLKDKYGYKTIEECFLDRENHRAEWFDAIAAYNHPDGARLGREIFAENTIYCGMRNDLEFDALKKADLIDLAIFIDASGRLPLEDRSSMKLGKEHADVIIENNGNIVEFYTKLHRLFQNLNLQ